MAATVSSFAAPFSATYHCSVSDAGARSPPRRVGLADGTWRARLGDGIGGFKTTSGSIGAFAGPARLGADGTAPFVGAAPSPVPSTIIGWPQRLHVTLALSPRIFSSAT